MNPGRTRRCPHLIDPSLLDTTDKLFEIILLTRILCKVGGLGYCAVSSLDSDPQHSTALQLNRVVGRVSRNVDKKWLTGAVFLEDGSKVSSTN